MEDMFFKNWDGILRVVLMSLLAYVYLIIVLRVTGKRTLSKMNAFDFIVTVAFGSTLATIILSKDVTLAEGVVALTMLTLLQYIITWLSVRSKAVSELVKSEPRFLYYQGKFLEKALQEERVTQDEVLAAMRSSGISGLEQVEAVVLETSGSMSALKKQEGTAPTVLHNVKEA
ncbi:MULTISPECIES: DUF421 domain-containing protein [Rufibacter]|uniref:Uncharacterized membrane protein YcaP (DUF421 family) n=1 Tax=Rufibacter quisquiliarum TaxID=1549639 RepID=A0A839GTH4_9BACT|nr:MULTISPECIES: YetF domain-containing protein [Rufibacter]MBA9078177.1 uncharacterized membrane protein YcaP (DUF421 family) [Rufibacter quisquiliarum]